MTTSGTIVPCPVCSASLDVRLAHGKKSGKPFIMLVCPVDGRHFRAFIYDRSYMDRVMAQAQVAGAREKGE